MRVGHHTEWERVHISGLDSKGGHLIALATKALSNDCMMSTITVGNTNVATGGTPTPTSVVVAVSAAKEGKDKGCRSVRWRISRDDSVTEKYRACEGAVGITSQQCSTRDAIDVSVGYVSIGYE